MVKLTLLEKIYGPMKEDCFGLFQEFLSSVSSGLESKAEIIDMTRRNWIQVDVSGSDSIVLTNYLAQKSGLATTSFEKLTPSTELKGRIVDSGKVGYGLYIDVGIASPEDVDALIPLHVLRKQLVEGEKLSTRKIIEAYCLYDNLPIRISLTKVAPENKLEAEFSNEQLQVFNNWLHSGLDRVITLGASVDMLENALEESGSTRDVVKIENLGFLEHALLCKLGTDAPGIIHQLGRSLPRIPLHSFSPKKIRELTKNE